MHEQEESATNEDTFREADMERHLLADRALASLCSSLGAENEERGDDRRSDQPRNCCC